ncbi:MAG: hypothetical protein IJZ19_10270 [Lentisphaeria bacterium]|nr:hypothetical protein [Lentisphaeria bacterium]
MVYDDFFNQKHYPYPLFVLRRLLRFAGLITVSLEDIWLRLLRIAPDWDFGKAEATLRRFSNN